MSSKPDSYTQPLAMRAIFARHPHEQSSMENTGIVKKANREKRGEPRYDSGRKKKKEGETEPHTTHRWIEFIARETRRL